MKTSRFRFPLIAALVVGVGAALALALPAGAAVSLQSQSPPTAVLKLGYTATLDARGAVIFSPVDVTCAPGATAYLTVQVTENVGNAIASGSGSVTIRVCNGALQRQTVAVTPTQKPFKRGVAFGQASMTVCGYYSCDDYRDMHNVLIR